MEDDGEINKGAVSVQSSLPGSSATLPRAGFFSPKVMRPKLPLFASTVLAPSKKDPAREDMKMVLEDIEKVRKFNFEEFKRPRHQHPSAFATLPRKSHSATVSPCQSPRICSPSVDDPRSSRDRLKMLTSYLKNKSGSLLSEQNAETGQNSVSERRPFVHEGSVPAEFKVSRMLSPEHFSDEHTGRLEEERRIKTLTSLKPRNRKVSPNTLMKLSFPHLGDSLSSKHHFSHVGRDGSGGHSSSPSHSDSAISDTNTEPSVAPQHQAHRLKVSQDGDRGPVGKDLGLHLEEDEGVGEISDVPLSPVDIPSSSLDAGPSGKGRDSVRPDPDRDVQEKSSSQKSRLQKRGELGSSGKQKPTARFNTHPPQSKGCTQEAGPMDSNGFAALKTPDTDDNSLLQHSQTSLADSQLTSEDTDEPKTQTFHDVMDSLGTGHTSESSDSDKQEKKKTAKQKSHSDPSGNRSGENLEFVPEVKQSHSAPQLKREKDPWTTDDDNVSISDSTLSPSHTSLATEKSVGRSSDNEDFDTDGSLDSSEVLGSGKTEDRLSPQPVVSYNVKFSTSVQSPSRDLKGSAPRGQDSLLTVPPVMVSRRRIPRSASSASELTSRKHLNEPERKQQGDGGKGQSGGRPITAFIPLADSNSAASSMPSVWKEQLSYSESPERELGFIKDKRYHIVEELYRNEKEYVEALRVLKEKYMGPLKNSSNVDDTIVDNIFYMIPEILMHHSVYLDLLDKVWKNWDSKTSTTGDKILAIFSKQTVLESYLSFVENYKTSGKVIENALTTKSSMQKFIEQCQRESGSKLSMKDLIVRPIQRIPRYELLIQRLLDNTPADHPDHPLLQQACRAMHELAMKIGTVTDSQQEEDMQETLKKLELLLITDLAAPERAYIRHDMVHLLNKKDPCCVWLFSDLIILSSVKRKSGPVTRKVSIILKTPSGQDFTENIKHKVWLKVGLDCLEIVKPLAGALTHKPAIDKDQLEEDLNILSQISQLCGSLVSSHQNLAEAIKELNASLSQKVTEATLRSIASESNKVELLVTTQEGIHNLEMGFTSAEKRAAWETAFSDAKNKLSMLTNKRAPEFLHPLQITKTRAGMQFSCAAPIEGLSSSGCRDVWVCNSDGYVGHMCLLSLQPEPIVTLNTPVPGCNARILCICAVPAFGGGFRRKSSQKGHSQPEHHEQPTVVNLKWPQHQDTVPDSPAHPEPWTHTAQSDSTQKREDDDDDDDNTEEGYQSDSDSSEDEDEDDEEDEEEEDEDEDDENFQNSVPFLRNNDLYVGDLLSDEEIYQPRVSEMPQSSLDPITAVGTWQQDPYKSTMWLGTEDGCIHIFQCTDNIKTTKNKLRIQHGSPVHCIVYLDNKVFASLVNGDLIVYKRDSEGLWDTEHPYTRTIGSVSAPITRMLPVAGKLWCGCQNSIHVINPLALNTELSFQVMSDPNRTVQCMVCCGQGVWVACQHSSKISLFHATTYEFLLEVSIAQAVSQKLQSADDIIRQHKAACLRITALLVCKDLLWVGTSAGVILTVPIPKITSTTTHGSLAVPSVTGLVYGHTGHVRFLTAVELWGIGQKNDGTVASETTNREAVVVPDIHRRSSVTASVATMATRMLVISGGDGYEDFRNSSASDVAGRDDSTNHLLLWQV